MRTSFFRNLLVFKPLRKNIIRILDMDWYNTSHKENR